MPVSDFDHATTWLLGAAVMLVIIGIIVETVIQTKRLKKNPQFIVGLTGVGKSGKDSVAAILSRQFDFRRLAHADMLKNNVAISYNIPREFFDDPAKKDMPIEELAPVSCTADMTIADVALKHACFFANTHRLTYRGLLVLEAAIKRFVNPDIYANAIVEEIKTSRMFFGQSSISRIVVTDVRYPNEIPALQKCAKELGIPFVCARVERFAPGEEQHPSPADHQLDHLVLPVISNRGTLADLETTVVAFLQQVRGAHVKAE